MLRYKESKNNLLITSARQKSNMATSFGDFRDSSRLLNSGVRGATIWLHNQKTLQTCTHHSSSRHIWSQIAFVKSVQLGIPCHSIPSSLSLFKANIVSFSNCDDYFLGTTDESRQESGRLPACLVIPDEWFAKVCEATTGNTADVTGNQLNSILVANVANTTDFALLVVVGDHDARR